MNRTLFDDARTTYLDTLQEDGTTVEKAADIVIHNAMRQQPAVEAIDAIYAALAIASTDNEKQIIDTMIDGFIGGGLWSLVNDIIETADELDRRPS